jgi:hypothetical protein
MERKMMERGFLAIAAIAAVGLAGAANAADKAVAPAPAVVVVQECAVFHDAYRYRGFGWGSGPGLDLGFGAFEGALPRYVPNSFPNWYGTCPSWGRYSAAGSARP